MENKIIADLKDSYGITFDKITPVTGGWLFWWLYNRFVMGKL